MDDYSPITFDLTNENSNCLYIFFGGITAGIAIPPFEFYNASKIIDENKIFIRDFSQCCYQNGLPGISSNIYKTMSYIKHEVMRINPSKLYLVGNSMGGYAAITAAALLGKGEVIAFAPQTFISPLLRFKYKDNRWNKKIVSMYKRCFLKRKIMNLRPLLFKKKHSERITIYTSSNDKLDTLHALYIKEAPNVVINMFSDGDHQIVKVLKDKGLLPPIMTGQYIH